MVPNNGGPIQGYRRVALSLDEHELAMADRIADTLGRGGAQRPDRSTVLRLAVESLIDELRGQSKEEIVRFFLQRRSSS